jgi:hypothetical protein
LDLCFKIGDDMSEPPVGPAGSASIRTFALTQHADRDRHPSDARLEPATLELGAQRAGRGGAHARAIKRSEKVIGAGGDAERKVRRGGYFGIESSFSSALTRVYTDRPESHR